MSGLYQKLSEIALDGGIAVLTVLDGTEGGQKALVQGGSLIWESTEQGFFSQHKEVLGSCEMTEKRKIAGRSVFCDCISGEKQMIICGGGHVSMPVIRLAKMIGFRVVVLEDRQDFADRAKTAGADEVICTPEFAGLDQIAGNSNTYFVVVTRAHRFDQICLKKIFAKKYAYVGMMGSKSRVAMVKETLVKEGIPEEKVGELHSPIGLAIRAETPEEIAISILGEIIQEKNKKGTGRNDFKGIWKALMDPAHRSEETILATIVERRGSAPRSVVTKMVIFQDGAFYGTIGGGAMEHEVLSGALQLLEKEDPAFELLEVNMSTEDGGEAGMVCGGRVLVLLERVSDIC